MLVQEPVQVLLWNCLNNYAYRDAIFIAERLNAELYNEESHYLLATCLFRSGQHGRAYFFLKNGHFNSARIRYLKAECCFELKLYEDVELCLFDKISSRIKDLEISNDIFNEFKEIECFAMNLLAKAYVKTKKIDQAVKLFKMSLKKNPFLSSSIEALCHLDPSLEVEDIIPDNCINELATSLCQKPPNNLCATDVCSLLTNSNRKDHEYFAKTPVIRHRTNDSINQAYLDQRCLRSRKPNSKATPTSNTIYPSGPPPPPRKQSIRKTIGDCIDSPIKPSTISIDLNKQLLDTERPKPSFGHLPLELTPSPSGPSQAFISSIVTIQSLSDKSPLIVDTRKPRKKLLNDNSPNRCSNQNIEDNRNDISDELLESMPLRRSTRLLNPVNNNVFRENNKSQAYKKSTRLINNTKKFKNSNTNSVTAKSESSSTIKSQNDIQETIKSRSNSVTSMNSTNDAMDTFQCHIVQWQKKDLENLLELFRHVTEINLMIENYRPKDAIDLITKLPKHHFSTAWAYYQYGKAYYLLSEYDLSNEAFEIMLSYDQLYIDGMDIYSSVLWHLSMEPNLSSLCHFLGKWARNEPQTWLAHGNCFSVQKDHTTALKFFKRAIQIDEFYYYAYALMGHDYMINDELDSAIQSFREALDIDPRHFYARLSIGSVRYRQEKFIDAEMEYREALRIYPTHIPLLCQYAMTLHHLDRSNDALPHLDRGIEINANHPLCKYHKATILVSLNKLEESIVLLEELLKLVPKESAIYYLLSHIYKIKDDVINTKKYLDWATELDPKGAASYVKDLADHRKFVDNSGVEMDSNDLDEHDHDVIDVDSQASEVDSEASSIEIVGPIEDEDF